MHRLLDACVLCGTITKPLSIISRPLVMTQKQRRERHLKGTQNDKRKFLLCQIWAFFYALMEFDDLLVELQKRSTSLTRAHNILEICIYKRICRSNFNIILQSCLYFKWIFFKKFFTEILKIFLVYPIRATCSIHLNLLRLF